MLYTKNETYRRHRGYTRHRNYHRHYRRKPPYFKYLIIVLAILLGLWLSKFLINSLLDSFNPFGSDQEISDTKYEDKKDESSDKDEDDEDTDGIYYYYESINEADKELYDTILKGINNFKDDITVNTNDIDKINDIIEMIRRDHAEIFWFKAHGIYQIDGQSNIVVDYSYDKKEVQKRQVKIESSTKDILNQMSETQGDYAKAKLAYEYIIDTVKYDLKSKDNQNLYSSLVNKKSVCAGYASGLQYLLQKSGIQSILVTGTANGENHAWNIIKYKNQFYNIDVTFGDSMIIKNNKEIEREKGTYDYSYFFVPDDILINDHAKSKDRVPYPKCSHKEYAYYIRKGTYSEDFDDNVINAFKQFLDSNEKEFSWQFSNKESYKKFKKSAEFGKIRALINFKGSSGQAYIYKFNDNTYVVTIAIDQ